MPLKSKQFLLMLNNKLVLCWLTVKTESCNGRIPTRGAKTIYLGFENERVRFNNYVWLEVVGVVPTTDYFKESYSLE